MTSPNFKELQLALDGLLQDDHTTPYRAVWFVLPVKPMPAPRAKFTRDGYSYSPKPYVTWRGQVSPHIPHRAPLRDCP
jgi:hypothetical protein